NAASFIVAMEEVGRLRRRDGSITWGLYRDTGDPDRYLEPFVSESWGEHMRQHARATMADRRTEARARAFHTGEAPPVVSHTIHVPRGGHHGLPERTAAGTGSRGGRAGREREGRRHDRRPRGRRRGAAGPAWRG